MRQPHDQFAKECAAEMLEQLNGKVNIQHQLHGEVASADLSFELSPMVPKVMVDQLGLFSKLAAKPCLMECFNRQSTVEANCSGRLVARRNVTRRRTHV